MSELEKMRNELEKLEDPQVQEAIWNHEDRITNLEEVALILRAKVEPETLTPEAIERAHHLAVQRARAEEPDAIDRASEERIDRRC